jgi:hypothetical protein
MAVALFVPLALDAPAVLGGYRDNLGVTEVEVAQLPKFCWAQMEVPGATGPGYTIDRNECGYLTNHYCEGLVRLMRFKSAGNKQKQLTLLRQASEAVAYTEGGIKNYPRCSIRPHVAATRAEVNTLLNTYDRSRAKR